VPVQRRPERAPVTAPVRAATRLSKALRRWLDAVDRALGAEVVIATAVGDAEQQRIIGDVLTAGARHVSAVMVPRTRVIYLEADLDVADAVHAVRDTPHSRFPVIDKSHDDVTGFVHLRDLLMPPSGHGGAGRRTVGSLARRIHRVPASLHVLTALAEMRGEGHQLAVVEDEYGGTAGIVTLEDLIEELIGEIHDEYDAVPDPETDADGRVHLADFAERYGFELPPGPYETLGGFMMARLGRLPTVGDEVRVDGWRLFVTECDGRRVGRVSVRADS
jgi:putative hemolysin